MLGGGWEGRRVRVVAVVAVLLAHCAFGANDGGVPAAGTQAAAPDATALIADPIERQRAVLLDARRAQVDALAPNAFDAANDAFDSAVRDRGRGRSEADVLALIQRSMTALENASRVAESVRAQFPSAAAARADAIKADAYRLAPQQWARADARFGEAMSRAERGDNESARGRANDAEALMRAAELEAIRSKLLGPARALIAQADATRVAAHAPRTLNDARRLADQAAQEIERNRYDLAVPRELAARAEYQARHAVTLAGIIRPIVEGRSEDAALESLILDLEAPLEKIAAELAVPPRFDEGFLRPIDDMLRQAKTARSQIDSARADAAAARQEVAALRAQIAALNARLSEPEPPPFAPALQPDAVATPTSVSPYQAPAAVASTTTGPPDAASQGDLASRVRARFGAGEVSVLASGDNVVLRLDRIGFAPTDANLTAGAKSLLVRVRDALAGLRGVDIMVEGHAESSGNDEADRQLSQDRANAVRQQLIELGGIPQERVTSMGYGSTRPLVSGGDPDARRVNGRVEIVLRPAGQG